MVVPRAMGIWQRGERGEGLRGAVAASRLLRVIGEDAGEQSLVAQLPMRFGAREALNHVQYRERQRYWLRTSEMRLRLQMLTPVSARCSWNWRASSGSQYQGIALETPRTACS